MWPEMLARDEGVCIGLVSRHSLVKLITSSTDVTGLSPRALVQNSHTAILIGIDFISLQLRLSVSIRLLKTAAPTASPPPQATKMPEQN